MFDIGREWTRSHSEEAPNVPELWTDIGRITKKIERDYVLKSSKSILKKQRNSNYNHYKEKLNNTG